VTETGRPAGSASGVKFLRQEEDYSVYSVSSGLYSFGARF